MPDYGKQVHISNYDILMRNNNEYLQNKQRMNVYITNVSPPKKYDNLYRGSGKYNYSSLNKSLNYSLDGKLADEYSIN